jgi:threonine dehydrogenase-like Zn-dependent dehydrogenase
LTFAGTDDAWSARSWSPDGRAHGAESVRIVGDTLNVTFNDTLRPPLAVQPTQLRTVSGWGDRTQRTLAGLRVLVVGVGSVGLDVALRLAASGIQHIGVMDYDTVELHSLDRLVGANRLDVALHRAKVDVPDACCWLPPPPPSIRSRRLT